MSRQARRSVDSTKLPSEGHADPIVMELPNVQYVAVFRPEPRRVSSSLPTPCTT